jgi:hypothetical protein
LGAGVAWQEKNEQGRWAYKTSIYSLGVHTGTSADAGLFGITTALRLVVEKVGKDAGVKHVRIPLDYARMLQCVWDRGITLLGSAGFSPWALQQVYDNADLLVGLGVEVGLV